jgi:hypothetical protein
MYGQEIHSSPCFAKLESGSQMSVVFPSHINTFVAVRKSTLLGWQTAYVRLWQPSAFGEEETRDWLRLGRIRNGTFCWPCNIWTYPCDETNLSHYLSSVYWVTTPLHVSALLLAHHQEVVMYICDSWYVLYFSVDCQQGCWQSTDTYQLSHIYITTSWWWATSKPETCGGGWLLNGLNFWRT